MNHYSSKPCHERPSNPRTRVSAAEPTPEDVVWSLEDAWNALEEAANRARTLDKEELAEEIDGLFGYVLEQVESLKTEHGLPEGC